MSLALDSSLAARMNEQSRRPLVEIKSMETIASIPFDGTLLASSSINEQCPSSIFHSSGRICLANSYGNSASPWYLRYRVSDVNKTEFTLVDIPIEALALDVSLTELPNHNIGIVYRYQGSILYRIITVTGEAVSSGLITTYSTPYDWSGPFVFTMPDNSFLMIYVKNTSGPAFLFCKRTSTNFTAWSAETQITISGLTDAKRKANPFLFQLAGSTTLWLLFDYADETNVYNQDLSNIYYSQSVDSGATWGAAVKLTNFTQYKEVAKHPAAVQKTDTSMHLIFDKYVTCLHMNPNTLNWGTIGDSHNIHFDAVNRKLYVTNAWLSSSSKLANVVVVDVDTWTVIKRYDENTTPAIPYNKHYDVQYPLNHYGDGQYHPLVGYPVGLSSNYQIISVICGQSDSIINIHPHPSDPECNVTGIPWPPGAAITSYAFIMSTFVQASQNRIWVHFECSPQIAYTKTHIIGYFSLAGGGSFAFTQIVNETYAGGWPNGDGYVLSNGQIKVYPEQDLLIVNFSAANGTGGIKIYHISSGALWKTFRTIIQPDFPVTGLRDCCLLGGIIYGCDTPTAAGYETERYLYKINIGSELIQKEPLKAIFGGGAPRTYCCRAIDGYRIIIATGGSGIGIYNIATNEWTVYNTTNVPGLFDVGNEMPAAIYDLAADMVYSCSWYTVVPSPNTLGISAFSAYGILKQTRYYIGDYSTSWSFVDHGALLAGQMSFETSALVDQNGDVLYAFWTFQRGQRYFPVWDKETAEFNLDPYITVDTEIVYRRSIDGSPASLSFEVSHGHLFDVYNKNSLLSPYLKKGRRLSLRFGERISGTNYWQNMGSFIVIGQKIRYARGEYPVMQITAEDKSQFWPDLEVTATSFFQGKYPEEIVRDLLMDHADISETDIILGTWTGRSALTQQWIESDLKTVLTELANRYGYYLRIDVEDDIRARKISDENAVDVTYPDKTKIINFSPEDSYASTVNRVIVTGTELNEIEVLYAEERIAGLNGQVAYNTGKEDHIVPYSQDLSRRCRYPRLQVIKTSTSIGFELAGEISEALLDIDPNERYCVVRVDSPDLTDELIISLSALVASYFLPDFVETFGVGANTGLTIRVGSYLTALFTWTTMQILGATGSYEYAIWAQPVGKVKRSVQGEANDMAHQALVRKVITKKIDDPLCYSVADCQAVANQELKVARLQRNRCRFEMVADLRNEDGDTIQINHPYSNQAIKVFITEIERAMKKPAKSGGDGYFIDRIEGWVLS